MKTHTHLKDTGSLVNFLLGNNDTEPKVGEGATIMLWTDRYAYEVVEYDPIEKKVVLQRYAPKRVDKNGMSDAQKYEYDELVDSFVTLRYKWGAWRQQAPDGKWPKVNVVFGVKREYYDYSF